MPYLYRSRENLPEYVGGILSGRAGFHLVGPVFLKGKCQNAFSVKDKHVDKFINEPIFYTPNVIVYFSNRSLVSQDDL